MRNYIILNGVNSNTITGLLISTLPPITKPKIRTQTEEIDGRDGDIVTKLGYSAYDKEIEIGLYGNFDINEVIAYFNTEGTIVFSNEADKYYNYQILDQIDYEKLIRFKTAKVKMHVQPFKYPLEETPVDITIETINNEAETMSINNTSDAPITLALKGNTSQDGTPTPEAPVEVNTVTGRQEVVVCGKNIFDKNNANILNAKYNNGVIASDNNERMLYIPCQPNTTYTLYHIATSPMRNSIGTTQTKPANNVAVENAVYSATSPKTITTNANAKYIIWQFYATNDTQHTLQQVLDSIQIEAGSEATTYEAYKGQSYELDLGKNVFDGINREIFISAGANQCNTYTGNVGGYVIVNGGKYTISTTETQSKYRVACINSIPSSTLATCYNGVNKDNTKDTITIDTGNYKYLLIYATDLSKIQVERGDTASSFAPYKTPIEVNYMPNTEYQDYIYKDNNKWYIKRQIGKYVYNNDLTNNSITADKVEMLTPALDIVANTRPLTNIAICNMMGSALSNYTGLDGTTSAKKIRVNMSTSYASSYNEFNTLASNNNFTIYYILGTPEDEEITDNTLIGQLNALENARSYDPTTNISQNTANKPFIINATAVQKGSDTGNVDNIGNIYAKPTIDIEGSGIVEIYLDGNQIFNVDLSTINECVIDTTNLEAYDPSTTQLMNRQVTGDYSNFKIDVGTNQVKVSGAVTKATISNYTRWL